MLPAHNLVFGESEESRAAKRDAGRVWKGGQRQIIGMLLCVCVCVPCGEVGRLGAGGRGTKRVLYFGRRGECGGDRDGEGDGC